MNRHTNLMTIRRNYMAIDKILNSTPHSSSNICSKITSQTSTTPPQDSFLNVNYLPIIPNQINKKEYSIYNIKNLKENLPHKVKSDHFIITNGKDFFKIPKDFILMKKFNKLLIFSPNQTLLSQQNYNELMIPAIDSLKIENRDTNKNNRPLEKTNLELPMRSFTIEQIHSMKLFNLKDCAIDTVYKTEFDLGIIINKTKLSIIIPKNYRFFRSQNNNIIIYNEQNKNITELEKYTYLVKTYQLYDLKSLHKPVKQIEPYKKFNVSNYVANEEKEGTINLKDNQYYVKDQKIKGKMTFWRHVTKKTVEEIIPWKIHIYIDELSLNTDWNKMTSCILPYLCDRNDVKFKMVKDKEHFRLLKKVNKNQSGKAIVIYPRSKAQFIEISKHISQIIQTNNLSIKDSKIIGDRQLGETGRIFYRYADITGETYKIDKSDNETLVYSPSNYFYEHNRGNNNYMANDMTNDDDIFLNFNPDIA